MISIQEKRIQAKERVDLAIIYGHFGNKKNDKLDQKKVEQEFFEKERRVSVETEVRSVCERLPLPEGDNSGPPCSVKCIDNCDEQCRVECPELYIELCGEVETKYDPPPDSYFDWGENVTEDKPHQLDEEDKPVPPGVTAKANASGDNNNQTNIVGDNNRVMVQGGAGQNNSPVDPIEQAMAKLLLRGVPTLKSGGEVAVEQARGLLRETADAAVRLAPSIRWRYRLK
jgi:hypothetical protein